MRIIAELPHPEFKISILNMNQKFIIKIEQGSLEQSYKIPDMDLLDGVNSVFELLDEDFLSFALRKISEIKNQFDQRSILHYLINSTLNSARASVFVGN